MSYDRPDVYYQPEAFDLTPFGGLDEPDMSYEFHILEVWLHKDGTLYYAEDSGCSCPSPFEEFTSLDQLKDVAIHWDSFVQDVQEFGYWDRATQSDPLAVEKVDLIRRCSALIPDPDFTELKEGLTKLVADLAR